jgi:hypothetical protein
LRLIDEESLVYSYLIGSAGNRSKYFPQGIGKDQSVLLPEVKEVPIMRGKLFDLLPALPLNNCFIT